MTTHDTPKYHRGQIVFVSLYNKHGEYKNDLAQKNAPYFAKSGVLTRCQWYPRQQWLVYSVKLEDGTLIQLTEDCLVPVSGFHGTSKAQWHGTHGRVGQQRLGYI